jgi:cold shock CspA family protein
MPLQVIFRDVPSSQAVEQLIGTLAQRLEHYCARINGCRVTIAEPHRHRRRGRLFSIRIDLTVPGEEIVINREHRLHEAHRDVSVAVREAFHVARRRLEDYLRRVRRQVKAHEPTSAIGTVFKLFPDADCGFIRTRDGRDIYFHRNSVLRRGFDRLRVGREVRFIEEQGLEGPSATSVQVWRRPRRSTRGQPSGMAA